MSEEYGPLDPDNPDGVQVRIYPKPTEELDKLSDRQAELETIRDIWRGLALLPEA